MSRAVIMALASLALLQTATAQEDLQKFSDTVSVGYVMVPFTVLGQHGAPLIDLQSKEVQLLVDGQPVRSDMFERAMNAPVSFTILLDGSGSMALAGKLEAARAAVATLFAHRIPGDDFSLFIFDDREAREAVPFTSDITRVAAALRSVKPFGKTAFFDALATMPERSELGKNPTRAIILLSDGIDNASHLTREQLAARLEGVAVPIYPLGLRPAGETLGDLPGKPDEELSDLRLLDEIARITGGKLFVGDQPGQLSHAIDAIEGNLRAQYLIGFAPTGRGAVKYHPISLRLDGRARSVRVRAGYKGTEPPRAGVTKVERMKSR